MDYEAKLSELKQEISELQNQLARHEGAKATLNVEREAIISKCKALGVKPTLVAIKEEIEQSETQLSSLISLADKLLKKEKE